MKFLPGKKYLTASNRVAEIYSVDNGGLYPIHGRILDDSGNSVECWMSDGTYGGRDTLGMLNLLSEVKGEPPGVASGDGSPL